MFQAQLDVFIMLWAPVPHEPLGVPFQWAFVFCVPWWGTILASPCILWNSMVYRFSEPLWFVHFDEVPSRQAFLFCETPACTVSVSPYILCSSVGYHLYRPLYSVQLHGVSSLPLYFTSFDGVPPQCLLVHLIWSVWRHLQLFVNYCNICFVL